MTNNLFPNLLNELNNEKKGEINMTNDIQATVFAILGNNNSTPPWMKDNANSNTPSQQGFPASEAQIKYAKDLCEQKGVIYDEERVATRNLANAYIQELQSIKRRPVSDKQKMRIQDLCRTLNLPEPDYTKLDGSMDGTASQFIQRATAMLKDRPIVATEAQKEYIKQMQLCPSCEEVADIDAMGKQEASDYISKYGVEYRAWVKTRLSVDQLKEIERLHAMIGTPFDYKGIIQLDVATATKYIDQLCHEIKQAEWKQTTLEECDQFDTRTKDIRNDQDKVLVEMKALVAKLYASIGQQFEEDEYANMSWDKLKDLVGLVQLYGTNVSDMLESAGVFTEEQKVMLMA